MRHVVTSISVYLCSSSVSLLSVFLACRQRTLRASRRADCFPVISPVWTIAHLDTALQQPQYSAPPAGVLLLELLACRCLYIVDVRRVMCFADVERSAGDTTAPEGNITAQFQQQRTRYGKQRTHATVTSSTFNTDHSSPSLS